MSSANTPLPALEPVRSSRRRLANNVLRAGLGLALGLVIAEGAFWIRDAGAFPHVNFYVADAQRGVRLRAGATERIRFSKNPVTKVRVNADGYRGADWPAPGPDEVVVVGDSQVFGLGVEEDQTFSAVLREKLGGKTVRNQGVPTYGPSEYNAVLEETLQKRPAKVVVYTVNLSNDLFEVTRPNRDRHAVWDGWAVRRETAPASTTNFPGRRALFAESHAIYALRRFWYERGAKIDERGFASEGTFHDITEAATASARQRQASEQAAARSVLQRQGELRYARDQAEAIEHVLDSALEVVAPADFYPDERARWDDDNWLPVRDVHQAARLSPGDILTIGNGEASRDTRVNAEHIRRGAEYRRELEKRAREVAAKKQQTGLLELFANKDALARRSIELTRLPPPKLAPLSPMLPALKEAKAICDRHGARLLVVALPVDVQVDPAEWAKYGSAPVDMKSSRILLEDVVVAAEALGAEGIDVTPALERAEPGAFLDGDLHMTPKGHRAVGEAIARALEAPRFVKPKDDLPAERSWPPSPVEWSEDKEIVVRESDPAGCATKVVREWLGVFCRNRSKVHKAAAHAVSVSTGIEVRAGALPDGAILVAPLLKGQSVRATFTYEDSTRELSADVSAAGERTIAFSKPAPRPPSPSAPVSPETQALCACAEQLLGGASCSASGAVTDADCARTYASDCVRLLACSVGDPAAPPACPAGFAHAGAAHRCVPLCTDATPCSKGKCVEWQGGRVCM